MSTLGRKNCEYVAGIECGWVKPFSCVLVNLMTRKDRSGGPVVFCVLLIVRALPCPAVVAWSEN